MQTLHLNLKAVANNYIELRYFVDNPNKYERRSLSLTEVADLIELAERDYYVSAFPEDYMVTGRQLYDWLDGSDRWLQLLLEKYRREGVVLAIAAAEKLAHLPWELLHNGVSFLVQRVPAVVPVRWVSESTVKKLNIDGEAANRALQVLFMATSPLNVEPVLDFEGEEARILEATARQPLALTAEESGCLLELGYLVDSYGKDYFDVLHLTGHATLQHGQPRFVTETPIGEAYYASAFDIAQELQFRLPKLIFLSGCRTGQAGNAGSVPSMAEELLELGAKAVLGWGQKVLDPDATAAAAALYQELSAGKQITEAVASTYQALIKNEARDWHLLRLYTANNLPSSLVTPLRTRGRTPAPAPSVTTQFLDPAGKVKVPTRESFVGRRRQLQNCLRVLTQSTDEIGVLIHGMGGLGKSSLAARLCDRLLNFERVVWVGRIDEPSLVNRLVEKLDDNEQRKSLQNEDEELRFRVRRVFQQLHEDAKPFLLVLDDFEVNLEPRNESYVLQADAAEVLKALVWAIRDNYTSHRSIITCRYNFEFTQLQYFHKQPLDALQGADLRKKFNRLTAFGYKSQVDKKLKLQAQKLADGNPRLLEWLDKILQDTTADREAILQQVEADPVELREQVLAETLLQQIDASIGEILSRSLVFELPVPRAALEAVCESLLGYREQLERAIKLGLMEVSSELQESERVYRVSRILPLIIPSIQLSETLNVNELYRKGLEKLSQVWTNREFQSEGEWRERREKRWREIFRLMFCDQRDVTRITKGFSFMMYVQYDPEADYAYEKESEIFFKEESRKNTSCALLEYYLQKHQWIWANEETNRIFYHEYVSGHYHSRYYRKFLRTFPRELLNEIDKLWLKYSQGKFGFSTQKKILNRVEDNGFVITQNYEIYPVLKSDIWIEMKNSTKNKQCNYWDNFKRGCQYVYSLTINDFDIGYFPKLRLNERDKDDDSVGYGFSTTTFGPRYELYEHITESW